MTTIDTRGHLAWGRLAAVLLCLSVALAACDRSGSDGSAAQKNEGSSGAGASEMAPSEIPTDQSRRGWTRRKTYYVEVAPEPNPIPFQTLFELDVRIYESEAAETPVDKASIDQVRAVMPAHDHGMKTKPEWNETEPGAFRVRGMKFHMQGAGEDGHWVLNLLVNGPDGVDEASFDLQCCRP